MGKYDDIINMQHHVSKKHPQMSLEQRAAQFGAFSALKGYNSQIEEASKQTEDKHELTEFAKDELDIKLQFLQNNINKHLQIEICFFEEDEKKNGGKYNTAIGKLIKIDNYNKKLILENGLELYINNIYSIEYKQ